MHITQAMSSLDRIHHQLQLFLCVQPQTPPASPPRHLAGSCREMAQGLSKPLKPLGADRHPSLKL